MTHRLLQLEDEGEEEDEEDSRGLGHGVPTGSHTSS